MPFPRRMIRSTAVLTAALAWATPTRAAAASTVTSPDGRIAVSITDTAGLQFSVTVDGEDVLKPSPLGLRFKGNVSLGPAAKIDRVEASDIDTKWDNRFGTQRTVSDHCKQLHIHLKENDRAFGLIVRVYNDGVAFRYDLPIESRLGDFVLTEELTAFDFAEDATCWAGEAGGSAEVRYPEQKLSTIPTVVSGRNNQTRPYLGEPPLLVRTNAAFVAVAESDVIDWPAMFLVATGTPRVKVQPAERTDRNGLAVASAPRQTPWRVLMIARTASELLTSQLVATLATPARSADADWVKPGVAAWDPWWTGRNPNLPQTGQYTGINARGDTKADKDYIDLAAEMGWSYQIIDWMWHENMTSYDKGLHSKPNEKRADFTKFTPEIDVKELVRYAAERNVKLIVWAHSLDLKTFGEEKALAYFASLGVAGVKVDFLSSQSQETVQWVQKTLEIAAKYKLLINFHGTYHPTGLSRTYPNFITQEGVLGNEYNKLPGRRNDPKHQVTLPFTRALLGPMDYTPGGFLNRTVDTFKQTFPAQVMGTRARELALTVLYPSPLVVMCDAPSHYRGRPGVEFLRNLPTVWDETVVISAEVGKSVCLARRAGTAWYLVAINLDQTVADIPLSFLPEGSFTANAFQDGEDGNPMKLETATRQVTRQSALRPKLAKDGGFAVILKPAN